MTLEPDHRSEETRPAGECPEPPDAPVFQECWRCGKVVDERLATCPFCRARLQGDRWPAYYRRMSQIYAPPRAGRHVKTLMWFYGGLLLTSIIFAGVLQLDREEINRQPKEELERELLNQTLVVEAVDTVILIVAIGMMSLPKAPRQTGKTRLATWLLGAPLLAACFGVNLLYTYAVHRYIGESPVEAVDIRLRSSYWLVLLAICVQPAIVEELFFRYLALGQLRRVTGMHGAVWVSAIMFGFAHLYNPVGLPYLVLMGAALGYVRVASGGLLLPMLMHGFHNFLVVWLEAQR